MNVVWNEEKIRQLLATNNKAVEQALLVLLRNQTAQEQANGVTLVHNGVGFSSFDAPIMTSFAEQVLRGHSLSERQLAFLRKPVPRFGSRIGKYHRQLLEAIRIKQSQQLRSAA